MPWTQKTSILVVSKVSLKTYFLLTKSTINLKESKGLFTNNNYVVKKIGIPTLLLRFPSGMPLPASLPLLIRTGTIWHVDLRRHLFHNVCLIMGLLAEINAYFFANNYHAVSARSENSALDEQ
eukprot:scaffold2246_cov162-Amphora_coffeaeformis.AAC.26